MMTGAVTDYSMSTDWILATVFNRKWGHKKGMVQTGKRCCSKKA